MFINADIALENQLVKLLSTHQFIINHSTVPLLSILLFWHEKIIILKKLESSYNYNYNNMFVKTYIRCLNANTC